MAQNAAGRPEADCRKPRLGGAFTFRRCCGVKGRLGEAVNSWQSKNHTLKTCNNYRILSDPITDHVSQDSGYRLPFREPLPHMINPQQKQIKINKADRYPPAYSGLVAGTSSVRTNNEINSS
jgi:hypothetical protein